MRRLYGQFDRDGFQEGDRAEVHQSAVKSLVLGSDIVIEQTFAKTQARPAKPPLGEVVARVCME